MKPLATVVLTTLLLLACSRSNAQYGGEDQHDEIEKRLQKLEETVNKIGSWMVDLKKSPLANAEKSNVNVFRLKYIQAESAANTIARLFGNQGYRLAVDDKGNALILSAPDEISIEIVKLLEQLDAVSEKQSIQASPDQASKSLLVHTFWLADGLAEGEGRSPADSLPNSVLAALKKIGLHNPTIVSQNTASLIAKIDDASQSRSYMAATLGGQKMRLMSHAELSLSAERRLELQMQIEVQPTDKKKPTQCV